MDEHRLFSRRRKEQVTSLSSKHWYEPIWTFLSWPNRWNWRTHRLNYILTSSSFSTPRTTKWERYRSMRSEWQRSPTVNVTLRRFAKGKSIVRLDRLIALLFSLGFYYPIRSNVNSRQHGEDYRPVGTDHYAGNRCIVATCQVSPLRSVFGVENVFDRWWSAMFDWVSLSKTRIVNRWDGSIRRRVNKRFGKRLFKNQRNDITVNFHYD